MNQLELRTAIGTGSIKKVTSRFNNGSISTVTVQYMISGRDYEFSEDVECPVEAIQIGHPIKMAYNPHAPQSAHIVGNKIAK